MKEELSLVSPLLPPSAQSQINCCDRTGNFDQCKDNPATPVLSAPNLSLFELLLKL
jgi:hypothetical protein